MRRRESIQQRFERARLNAPFRSVAHDSDSRSVRHALSPETRQADIENLERIGRGLPRKPPRRRS